MNNKISHVLTAILTCIAILTTTIAFSPAQAQTANRTLNRKQDFDLALAGLNSTAISRAAGKYLFYLPKVDEGDPNLANATATLESTIVPTEDVTATFTLAPGATQTAILTPTLTTTTGITVTFTLTPGATQTATLPLTLTPTASFTATFTPTPTDATPTELAILAAGDIAKCGGGEPAPGNGAFTTSDMLLTDTGYIFTLGDNSNDSGSLADYQNCFGPTWGRLMDRLHITMGNHDIGNAGQDFFTYFSGMTGDWGHYSLNLGSWHVIVLNAECGIGGQGCGTGSLQETWLRQDLAANTQKCVLAMWHQPLFTSGTQTPYTGVKTFWQDLYAFGTDVILNGHNHNYERFDPQNPNAVADPNGIREFVVGTGGASLDSSSLSLAANEVVRSAAAYGYLRLTLHADSYDWQFVAQPGSSFTDSGSASCH